MEITDKQLEDLKQIHKIQGDHGNWNYDAYMHGMYNGMELMLATIEDREPEFRQAPEQWTADIEVSTAVNTKTVSQEEPVQHAPKEATE